jgi:hypothetical protein
MRWHPRTAVAGLVITLGIAGGVAVAASTDTLPIAGGRDDGPNPTAASAAAHTPGAPSTTGTPSPAAPASDAASSAPNGQGPDASGAARFGLCNAYTSGQGTTNGGKADSVAFQALATAAGGAGNIAAYCANTMPGGNNAHGTPPASTGVGGTANDNAAEHANPASDAQGPPADPGSNGQSHRP